MSTRCSLLLMHCQFTSGGGQFTSGGGQFTGGGGQITGGGGQFTGGGGQFTCSAPKALRRISTCRMTSANEREEPRFISVSPVLRRSDPSRSRCSA
eukprot:384669-Prorocentrum_minimum.AAC.1